MNRGEARKDGKFVKGSVTFFTMKSSLRSFDHKHGDISLIQIWVYYKLTKHTVSIKNIRKL